jgi:hypothetical protein
MSILCAIIGLLWTLTKWYYLAILVISVACPSYFHTEPWLRLVIVLVKNKEWKQILGLIVSSIYTVAVRTFLVLDTLLFPGIKDVEKEFFEKPGKLIFVLGHPRSGTTNIHSALITHPNCIHGEMTDLFFPSLLQKYFSQPFAFLVNFILDKVVQVNKSNHKMSDSEPLEEWLFQTWTYHRAMVFEFPSSDDDQTLR